MRKSTGALFFLGIAALATLVACNGNGIGGSPTPTTPPGTGMNCGGPPSANQMEVLFPIPGSKHAPAALENVYVSTKGQLPPSNDFDFYLVQTNGDSTFTSPFFGIALKNIPTPHATPSYSGAVYYASTIAGPSGSTYIIGAHQTVELLWNDGGTGCTPHKIVSTFRTGSGTSSGAKLLQR
jgi:hypothetical protein